MTLQEIKERIAVYESKWGKLGHTNIMKPENELQHSELNERRNTMIKTTNDFYKFRQKVAIGKEANKLAHKATISPEELNEKNFQNQIDNNTLIHAGKNFKYVAKEDVNGKPRYFYTQEEYDAFKNNKGTDASAGNSVAGAAGNVAGKLLKSAGQEAWMNQKRVEASQRVAQREEEKAKNRSKSVENYNNNARAEMVSGIVEVSKNGGSKAAADAMKDNPDYKLYMEMIQHAIDNGVDPQEHTVQETGKLLGKDYADAIKDAEKNLREYFDAVPGLKDDLAVIAIEELAEMHKKNKKGSVLESVGDKLGEDFGKGIAKSNIGEALSKNIKHSAFDEEDETPSYRTAADLRQEREESIMSEYRAFKARANKGAEKNRLSHSAVISPRDLNAKYEEELMKEYIAIHPENDEFESLSHSGQNFKYYAKVDLGNGNSRYFYTKEEYDAYNNPKKSVSVGPVKKETIVLADPNEKSITKKTEEFVNTDAIKRFAQDRKADEDKAQAKKNIKNLTGGYIRKGAKETYKKFEDSLEEEVKKRMKKIEKIDSEYGQDHGPAWNPYKNYFKDPEDIYEEWHKEWAQKANNAETPEEVGKINKAFEEDSKNIKAKINEELDKQEESAKTWIKVRKAAEKVGSIDNDLKKLDAYDAYSILEEMGLDSIDDLYDDDILKEKFGIDERIFDDMYIRGIDTDGDYGISRMNEMIDNYNNLWNAYKNAKKSLGHSTFNDEDDEDSLSHNSNGYGGTYLHKLDDFYGPGKPRYFYSEADWNAYQEGLKRNSYNADKEAEARQAKTDKQKADLARRSGMENYTKYQENKRADEEADARQAKIDEQKTRAKQKAGMEGYEQWNEKRQAEKEANAKKVAEDRNDMGGYAAWKRRRDYINNQKKASEAADAAEAEKHEIERKAVKNSVEVTKNKAAAKAQEAAEAEKREADSTKRLAEERAANAKKDTASKEAAIKAGQESASKLHAENEARNKEHKADKEKAKWNNLNNNVTSILEKASKKYDNQLEALNKEYDNIKDKSSPEAKAIKDKISQTNTKKDAELDKEIMTVVKDLGEIFESLEDKNGPEAKLLKAQAKRALDYSSNTKLAEVMGDANSWLNARMKYPKEV